MYGFEHSSDCFERLRAAIASYPQALDPISLHGYLAAIAVGPEELDETPWVQRMLGLSEQGGRPGGEIVDLAEQCIGLIREECGDLAFEPVVAAEADQVARHDLWCRGFLHAVPLAEKAWEELNGINRYTARNFLMINAMLDPEIAAAAFRVRSEDYEHFLAETRPLLGSMVNTYYQQAWGGEDEESESEDFELDPEGMPALFVEGELQAMSEDDLFEYVLDFGDSLPRQVFDEMVRRDQAMVPLLIEYLTDDDNWSKDLSTEEWWALLHCIFMLGAIPGAEAARGLLSVFPRMQADQDNALWEWTTGNWPALFRNKREHAVDALRTLAADPGLWWFLRSDASECVLETAEAAGEAALEETLDWLAAILAAEQDSDDPPFAAHLLLDFPRKRHRPLLEAIARREERRGLLFREFDARDIRAAYSNGGDDPQWRRFDDPWSFYDEENIMERPRRWSGDDQASEDFPATWNEPDFEPVQTYVRDTPKIGRNDPCPCGSGKKYKKCCLNKA